MIDEWLSERPEFALCASLAHGYLIGSFKVGPIQLGGVCGASIVARVRRKSGVRINPDLKNSAFAVFNFALGFTGDPRFFADAGRGRRKLGGDGALEGAHGTIGPMSGQLTCAIAQKGE